MCRLSAFNSGGTGALRVGRTSPATFPRSSVGMRGKSPPPPRSQNFFVKTGRKPRWTFGVPGSKIRLFQKGPDTGCQSMMITSSPTSFSYASKGETARRLARRLSPCRQKNPRTFLSACQNAVTFAPHCGAKVLASLAEILAQQGFRSI